MAALPLRIGPLLLCLCIALYRAVWLSWHLSGLVPAEIGVLLLADVPVLGLLALLALVERMIPAAWKPLPIALAAFLVAVYVADAVVVLALNQRLQLSDIALFGREWWLARSYLSLASIGLLIVAATAFLVVRRLPARTAPLALVAGLVGLALPWMISEQAVPAHLQKYTGSVLLLAKEVWGARRPPVSRYRPADFAAYRADYDDMFDAPFARTGKSIVLVIVESLSAADSYRTSQLRDTRRRFDELSRQGTLFRSFFANYEASEGGIVALLSGVPPMHFPTASTNTFGEYALQRSIVDSYARSGYHCEFLTSVPMQFISMDAYAKSPFVGFGYAAGQHETARYKDAPRFAFQSPPDRVLYEEALARLDARRGQRQPVLLALITASSHPPYVDPAGRGDNEDNAWAYVQDELWWLYTQLADRGFFDNGLLLITGDHRRMSPVPETERERYGDSAKARIPLLAIGSGAPKDRIDDRLFQQADLLRMLDRALQPQAELSPFAVWLERYVFIYGVASNASNLQVFDRSDPRRGYAAKLHGAEIEWITRPPNALAVERVIHRQRALQQAVREARLTPIVPAFGRDLQPSDGVTGILIGISSGDDLSRDPDDQRGSLRLMKADSLDLTQALAVAGDRGPAVTLSARAFMSVPQDGEYWFQVFADHASCLAIDKEIVLGCKSGLNEGVALLSAGLHRFDLRYMDRGGPRELRLSWLPPGATKFQAFPAGSLVLPR